MSSPALISKTAFPPDGQERSFEVAKKDPLTISIERMVFLFLAKCQVPGLRDRLLFSHRYCLADMIRCSEALRGAIEEAVHQDRMSSTLANRAVQTHPATDTISAAMIEGARQERERILAHVRSQQAALHQYSSELIKDTKNGDVQMFALQVANSIDAMVDAICAGTSATTPCAEPSDIRRTKK